MAKAKATSKIKKQSKPKSRAKKVSPMPGIKKVEGASFAKASAGQGKLVGKISHYFSNIEVGVIVLSGSLSNGDEIRIIGGESTDFNQKVDSMQVDHKEVKKAKKGDSVGLKVKEKVREGYKVYKV